MSKTHRIAIIGSGPAGHTAAIYAARASLEPVMYEGFMAGGVAAGGQLTTTTEVENFPGFPSGISGPELMDLMRKQSERFGTKIVTETIARLDLSQRPFRIYTEDEPETAIESHALILATGATARRLNLPGEDQFWQKGISACAVCDGALPMFKDSPLVVIGGGDSAAEEASYLTRYGSKVMVVHRRNELRASKIMADRLLANPKIEMIWDSKAVSTTGGATLEKVQLENIKTGQKSEVAARGLFYAIGHVPNTQICRGQLDLDDDGYILTKPGTAHTSVEGVFAAGDVQDKHYRQAITAAGSGCMAALEAERYLSARGF
jgi:thioredoxin reductase (NADPH)